AEFQKWRKLKDHEDEMRSRALRMRIPPPQPDRTLAIRYNGAWVAYEQARKAYEAMGPDQPEAAPAPKVPARPAPAPKESPRPAPPPPKETAASSGETGEWVPLFNGKDLTGWEGLPDVWQVKDGAIVATTFPKGRKLNTFLCSTRSFKDFELEFDVRLRG